MRLIFASIIFFNVLFQTSLIHASDISYITVRSIVISRPSIRSDLMIVKDSNGYRADHYRYSRQQAEALRSALEQQSLDRLDIRKLGINSEWLKVHRREAWNSLPLTVRESLEEETFSRIFQDETQVEAVLKQYYAQNWKGDFPEVVIEITLEGGKKLRANSVSQHAYMIPWTVRDGTKTKLTWNPDISRALSALLPPPFATNRERLAGDLVSIIAHRLAVTMN